MDLIKIIRELRDERDKLEQILFSLEQLQSVAHQKPEPEPTAKRGRRSMDPEARIEVSLRMKRYWADRRAKSATTS